MFELTVSPVQGQFFLLAEGIILMIIAALLVRRNDRHNASLEDDI